MPFCGGCAYQDLGYEAQLRLKEAGPRESLARAGAPWDGEVNVHASPERGWRMRASLHFGRGEEGPRLIRLARGEDEQPLVPRPAPESFECSLDLDWPVDGLEPLSFLLARVLDALGSSLAARARRAAALTLDLGLVDGSRQPAHRETRHRYG